MSALTLVSHDLCPYVQRAAIALGEKQVPFDRFFIDLSAKPDWFLTISPLGKTPLLRVKGDDGRETVLFESNVICEFIEETQAGPRLHPLDPLTRARHRAWIEFSSALLSDIYGLETAGDSAAFETKRQAVAAKLARVEDAFGEGPWFGGQAFGLVDAAFAPAFRYFDLFDQLADLDLWHALPKIRLWRSFLAQRPTVRDAVGSDYLERLRAFLAHHDAYLLKIGA